MKILFVLDYYAPHIGGVEHFFKKLAEGVAKQGHEVHVLTWRWKTPNLKGEEVINGVKIHRVWARSRYTFSITSLTKLFGLAKNADVVHTTTYQAAPSAFLVASILRKPCVITFHEFWGSDWMKLGLNPLYAKIGQIWENILIRLPFLKFLVPSQFTKQRLVKAGVKKDKIAVIYHGIDYSLFNPNKSDGRIIRKELDLQNNFVYTFFGRPGVSKGLEYLIDAIPTIVKSVKKAKFLFIVAKDPPSRYDLIKNIILEKNLEDYITLIDPVPRKELPNYLDASDCIVIPSIMEGFGFAAAEASAMEKPMVVSNVASLPEVVSGKVIFVPPKNSAAIAKACVDVYNRKYKIIPKKEFTWDDSIANYLKVYKEVLHES